MSVAKFIIVVPGAQIAHSALRCFVSRLDLGFGNINPTRARSQCRLPKLVMIVPGAQVAHSAPRYSELRLDLKFGNINRLKCRLLKLYIFTVPGAQV